MLITEDAIKAIAAGSVIVDMGAGPLGGNVAGSVPDAETVTENGTRVLTRSPGGWWPVPLRAHAQDCVSR